METIVYFIIVAVINGARNFGHRSFHTVVHKDF